MSDQAAQQEHAPITETAGLGGGAKGGDLMDAVKGLLENGEPPETKLIPTDDAADQGEPAGEPGADEGESLSDDGLGMQPTGGGEGGDTDADDGSLRALAEQAGVDLDDLYSTEISLEGDLGVKTIGELKDEAQNYARFEAERDAFEETRTAAETELLRAQTELQEVVAMLPPGTLTPELLQAARAKHAEGVQSERAALYRIRPEWKDPETFARVQEGIRDALAEYGFSAAEADSFFDHRATKLLHDFAVMRERFRQANAKHRENLAVAKQNRTRQGQPDAGAKARKQNKEREVARAASRPESKIEAVKALLDGATEP